MMRIGLRHCTKRNAKSLMITKWAFSETNEGNGDDRLKNRKMDRHTAKGDRDDRFAQMARKDPGEKARERMRRPA